MGDAENRCTLSVELQSLDGFPLRRQVKDELHLKPYHKRSKMMNSGPVSYVNDAAISHAIVLASGSKSKGFQTDQGAKLLPQDSKGRMENSKCKVSPAMLASHSSTSKRSRVATAHKAANKYELQYPSFKAVIQSHNLLKQNVVRKDPEIVPGWILKGRINGSILPQLLNIRTDQHGSGKLSLGWAAFQRGTFVKQGDVCVFGLVRIDNIEIKVSIFRRNVKT